MKISLYLDDTISKEKLLDEKSIQLLAKSPFDRESILSMAEDKSLTSNFGASIPFFPELKNTFNLPVFNAKSKVVLFLGGTKDQRKGWDLLESSLEFCKSSFVLLVVGGTSKKISSEYSQIEVFGIQNISNIEELRSLYSRSNLVVVPSRIEALPQTATEAMSCGTPVVGFDIGGLRDIITNGKNGILVPKFDIGHLSSAIDKILSRPKGDFAKSCVDFSSNTFSFKIVASKYKDIFMYL